MNNQLLKTILVGVLIGAAIFAAPFFAVKVLIFFLIIGIIFRVFRGRGYYHRRRWGYGPWAYADKIRGMSDQEYQEFQEKYQGRCWPGDSRNEENTRSADQQD